MAEDMIAGRSFGEVLADLAAVDPDRPAVTCGAVTLSRRDLDDRTNALARAYADHGVTPGSFVTIGLPNGIEFIESAFAAWKLGAIPQPVSFRLPPRELDAIVDLVQPNLLVGLTSGASPCPAVVAGFAPPPGTLTTPLPRTVSPYWKAPTSGGSTGRPKVIVAAQPAVIESVVGFGRTIRIPEDGTVITTGPLYHNGPFLTTAISLLFGSHVVVMPRFDAMTALELVEQHRADWIYTVPTMLLRMWRLPEADRERADLSSLHTVIHMAAPCPEWLKRVWIDWVGPERVWEIYGGSEVQAVTVIGGTDWLAHPGTVGKPFVGEICVFDDDGKPAAPGTSGPLWMRRGAGVPNPYRYIGAEARRRDGGWECLGDVGYLDDEGYVYLLDRDSDMIIVGGANVYPAEVEAVLEEHPAVRTSCAVGVPDEDLGQVVHAIVETAGEVTDTELLAFCAERLLREKVPRVIHRSATPLRDEAGKVRRSAVLAELVERLQP